MGIEAVDCGVRVTEEIRAAIGAFAGHPTTGLIVLPLIDRGSSARVIIELAANSATGSLSVAGLRHRRWLLSYGVDSGSSATIAFFI